MCPPIVLGVLSAAGSLYSMQQQSQQVKAGNKAAAEQQALEESRAKQEAMDRQNTVQNQALEESLKFKQERSNLQLEALRAGASQRVASAESGVGGVSSIRSFISQDLGEDQARSNIAISESLSGFNLNQQRRGIVQSKQERIENSLLTQRANTRRRPGVFDYAIAGVSSGVQGYSAGKSLKRS